MEGMKLGIEIMFLGWYQMLLQVVQVEGVEWGVYYYCCSGVGCFVVELLASMEMKFWVIGVVCCRAALVH